jgi:cephalosporin-C deacetylase-like acetyl esterase
MLDGQPVAALAGAGVTPTEIKPSLPVPDDFDAFWAAQKKKLAAVPAKAKLTPATTASKKAEVFDVQVDALGAPVSGYFARPLGAKPKSLPIILTLHGAGVRSANPVGPVGWAEQGLLAMDINAHGIPNGKPAEFYTDLTNGALKDYRYAGRESRETCYFLGMFLREVRALDFLCAQPEWDGKTVVVYGSSQGGFQAFAGAFLDPRVTFFAAGVPAGSDHTGMAANRVAGWPKLVPVIDGKPDPKVLEAARYFDNVNFAAHTKAKGAIVTVGFIDQTCPPTSVYAAFNALPIANKKIYHDIPRGHANSPEAINAMVEAVRAHLKAQQAQ